MTSLKSSLVCALSLIGLLSASAMAENFTLTGLAAHSLHARGFTSCNAEGCSFSDEGWTFKTIDESFVVMIGDGMTRTNDLLEFVGFQHFADEVIHFLRKKKLSKLPGVACLEQTRPAGPMLPSFVTENACLFYGSLSK